VSVLLVEDDPEDAALALRALAMNNLANRVHVVRDGVEALEYLDRNPAPRVVLLDLKLPRVNGLEVLRRIRADERFRILPVVVLSSSREEPDVRKAYELGVNSYIVKPVDFDQFVKAVTQAGLYWIVTNHPPAVSG
jgi:two-component system response regulator